MKLTAKTVDGIHVPAGKAEVIIYDEDIAGFGVRVREGGSRTFVYQYKIGQRTRRMSLGTAAKEAFPDIRKRVLDLQAQVRMGIDPAAQRDHNRSAETFKTIAERFLIAYRKTVKPVTYSETERYLLTSAKPLHGRPLADVTRRDIAEVLSSAAANVTKGTGDVTANRLRAALSTLFAWSMKEGLVDSNPTLGTYMRAETKRDRVLVDPETGDVVELVAVWRALDSDHGLNLPFSDIVRLLILTGQRRSEIGDLRWSELDEGMTRIALPGNRTKNGLSHLIPLSDPAREILRRQYRIVGRECVFAVQSNTGFTPWDAAKKALDARLPSDMPPWTLHDLRRSVATGMAHIGILPHAVEAVLNHQSGSKRGVAGIYNLNTYLPEKTAALTMWAEHVMAAVEGKAAKVVPMRAIRTA